MFELQREDFILYIRNILSSILVCDEALTTDLLFVLDTSSNTNGDQWLKLKDYVRQVITSFDVHNLLTRVSVITYGSSTRLDVKLNEYNTEEELLKAIDFITYHGGNDVNTGNCLELF